MSYQLWQLLKSDTERDALRRMMPKRWRPPWEHDPFQDVEPLHEIAHIMEQPPVGYAAVLTVLAPQTEASLTTPKKRRRRRS